MIQKSLKEISWNVPEEVYREDPAYSYSTLAKFNRDGFEGLNKLFQKVSSPSLLFGSVVDTLLTEGEEAFNERFFVATFPDISDSVKQVVQHIYNQYKDDAKTLVNIKDDDILASCDFLEYSKSWKAETRVKNIREKGTLYYHFLKLSENKEVISTEVLEQAKECVNALRESPATEWFFRPDSPFDNIERLYQLKFKAEYNGIPLRSMLDLAIVDHNNKTIQPCDLKTTGHPEYKFFDSYVKWNYDIQQSLYTYNLKQNIIKDPYFKDFKILPYKFIVICKDTQIPMVWEVSDAMATTEVSYELGDYKFKNWREIVTELDYYIKNSSQVPKGISITESNNLEEWLKKGK